MKVIPWALKFLCMHQTRPLKSSTTQTTLSYSIQNYYSLSFRGMSSVLINVYYETISYYVSRYHLLLRKEYTSKILLEKLLRFSTRNFFFFDEMICFFPNNKNICGEGGLENPRDGRAWWAAIYRVTQSQTRLKRLSSSSSSRMRLSVSGRSQDDFLLKFSLSCQCSRFEQTQ